MNIYIICQSVYALIFSIILTVVYQSTKGDLEGVMWALLPAILFAIFFGTIRGWFNIINEKESILDKPNPKKCIVPTITAVVHALLGALLFSFDSQFVWGLYAIITFGICSFGLGLR